MGYYTCPRCGGHDVYSSNVIQGPNIKGVVKCRGCGEILSYANNYSYSKEEEEEAAGCRMVLFIIIVIPMIVVAIGFFLFVVYDVFLRSK